MGDADILWHLKRNFQFMGNVKPERFWVYVCLRCLMYCKKDTKKEKYRSYMQKVQ